MTPEQIADLRAKAQAATPGTWRRGIGSDAHKVFDIAGRIIADDCGYNDGSFIEASNPAVVLELLHDLQPLRAETAKLRETMAKAREALASVLDLKVSGLMSDELCEDALAAIDALTPNNPEPSA
jgi:uncharacterized heparinase superfamily protein